MSSNTPLRILEVAGFGGIGTSQMGPVSSDIFYLSESFVELGHHVSIYDSQTGKERNLDKRIKLIEYPGKLRNRSKNKLLSLYPVVLIKEYFFAYYLKKRNFADEFDIIHIHESITAYFFRFFFDNNKLVYSAHTPTWMNPAFKPSAKRKVIDFFNRLSGIHDECVIDTYPRSIVLGQYLIDHFQSKKLALIPNGVDMKKLVPVEKKIARQENKISNETFLITCVARITPIKGIDVLLKAIRIIFEKHKNIQINIIGPFSGTFGDNDHNSYSQKILNLAEGLPVVFHGFISNKSYEFNSLIAASDIFIMSSLFDNQPNTVLEAFFHSIPVIGSKVGGIPDMVNEDTGYLFDSGNFEQLATTLDYAIQNRYELDEKSEKCHNFLMQNYKWEFIAQKHIKFFRNDS